MIQACLNGARVAGDSSAVPMSPRALAESATAAVAAWAAEAHVHPRTPCGGGSLSPRVVGPVVEAIRAVVDVPAWVSAGVRAEPDPVRRVERVRAWEVLPGHASVDGHEEGAPEVAAALLERGVGCGGGHPVQDGRCPAFPGLSPDAPCAARPGGGDGPAGSERRSVRSRPARRTGCAPGVHEAHRIPVLLHGADGGAWPVSRLALALGLDTRIGLEDVLVLPSGRPAASNADLVAVAAALAIAERKTAGPPVMPTSTVIGMRTTPEEP